MKHLYDSLRGCAKEEEVKAEFCKFFKMKIFAQRGIDHYTERILFEFKYDRYDWDRAPSTPCPKLVEDIFVFLTQRHRGTEKTENEGLLSLLRDSEIRSFGEDSKNPPNLQASKTPSSESNEFSEPLSLCVKNNPAQSLRLSHDALRVKLLPQIYTLGFLNPDVEYFV